MRDPEDDEAVVELSVGDVLDLHTFHPREVPDLVRHYLDLAWEKGLSSVRIVHGKGIGAQRQAVRNILARDPRVRAFGDAPGEAGGWGATVATFRRPHGDEGGGNPSPG